VDGRKVERLVLVGLIDVDEMGVAQMDKVGQTGHPLDHYFEPRLAAFFFGERRRTAEHITHGDNVERQEEFIHVGLSKTHGREVWLEAEGTEAEEAKEAKEAKGVFGHKLRIVANDIGISNVSKAVMPKKVVHDSQMKFETVMTFVFVRNWGGNNHN
jgi:hypothetical protein